MTDVKELDKLYEYGSKLLDSIETDFQAEIQRAETRELEFNETKRKFQEIVSGMEYMLEKVRGQGNECGE